MGTLKLQESESEVTLRQVKLAQQQIAPFIRKTPMLRAQLNGYENLWLKLENLQVTGAFKARGALNFMLNLTSEELKKGVVAASAGNHGAGVAFAAQHLKTEAVIFVPKNTDMLKINRLKTYGATVVHVGDTWDESFEAAKYCAENHGRVLVHPFADTDVMNGQGTIALEMLEDLENIDVMVAAIGGGGLISGLAVAAKSVNPNIKIVGVEPEGAATLTKSVKRNEIVRLQRLQTEAKSLAVQVSDPINLALVCKWVDELYTVSEEEIQKTAHLLWEDFGLNVEFSAAVALSALHSEKIKLDKQSRIAVVICGAGLAGSK